MVREEQSQRTITQQA